MSLTCCVDMSIQSPPISFTLLDKSQMFSINPHARCYRCSSLIDKDSTFRASCHNVRKCMKVIYCIWRVLCQKCYLYIFLNDLKLILE